MSPDLLDIQRVLDETFVASVERHPTLGSTNDRAAECAAMASSKLPRLITADRQTAGRGRGGNRWWTGPGSLAMSLLLDAEGMALRQPSQVALTALAAAVAVLDTAAALLPSRRLGLHWPNDVMVGDGKLAGILVEVLGGRRVVIGIGLNVNNTAADAPEEIRRRTASLLDLTGQRHDRTRTLLALVGHLESALAALAREPAALAARADAACLQRGRPLALRLGRETIHGECLGIANDGALRLRTAVGPQKFYSGVLAAAPDSGTGEGQE